MNVQRDPDAILAAWLEEGPNAPPRANEASDRGQHPNHDRQWRHPMWMPQEEPNDESVLQDRGGGHRGRRRVGGARLSRRSVGGVGGGPPASAAPSADAIGGPVPVTRQLPHPQRRSPSTVGWLPFTSSHYGYDDRRTRRRGLRRRPPEIRAFATDRLASRPLRRAAIWTSSSAARRMDPRRRIWLRGRRPGRNVRRRMAYVLLRRLNVLPAPCPPFVAIAVDGPRRAGSTPATTHRRSSSSETACTSS